MTTSVIEPNPRVTYKVMHEDRHLLVVSKRSGLPTQPGLGQTSATLLNGLFDRHRPALQNLGKDRSFGLVHRLDKDTSGLVAVALSIPAYNGLRERFEQRDVGKFYWAVSDRAPKTRSGLIRLSIAESRPSLDERAKHGRSKRRLSYINPGGKPAATAYRVLESNDMGSLIEARPVTGRLHQVRVHLDAIGCPILGDTYYGPKRTEAAAPRLALHAHRLTFEHPVTGEPLDIRTAWPRDLRVLLRSRRLHRPDLSEQPDSGEVSAPTPA